MPIKALWIFHGKTGNLCELCALSVKNNAGQVWHNKISGRKKLTIHTADGNFKDNKTPDGWAFMELGIRTSF